MGGFQGFYVTIKKHAYGPSSHNQQTDTMSSQSLHEQKGEISQHNANSVGLISSAA